LESLKELNYEHEINSLNDVDFEMQSNDLEVISELYDRLRDQLNKEGVGNNNENIRDFENLTHKIAEELKEIMNTNVDAYSRRGCIAKNKFLMYSLCLEKLLDFTKKNEELENIADTVYDSLKNEFIKLLSLFQEMIDSDQQNHINSLQLENEELKTELEMTYRELQLLKGKKPKESNGSLSPQKNDYNKSGGKSLSPRLPIIKDKDEQIGTINPRTLSLKQLKDLINDILKKKEN